MCAFQNEVSEAMRSKFLGCLLGGAVGDALGAPVEFLSLAEIRRRFGPRGIEGRSSSPLKAFSEDGIAVGEFRITPVALSHAPDTPTFGFVVSVTVGWRRRRVVVATDFRDPFTLLPHLRGADFVFLEANHDVELLRKRFNYASQWHLNNGQTASLLVRAFAAGRLARQRRSRAPERRTEHRWPGAARGAARVRARRREAGVRAGDGAQVHTLASDPDLLRGRHGAGCDAQGCRDPRAPGRCGRRP